MTRPLIVAHRGWSARAPENSLEAFALAAAGGADGVELDVHETADGGFVVHHDPDLPNGDAIADLPQFAVAGRLGKAGAAIPLLSEALALLAEQMAGGEVFVEIKGMRSWDRLRAVLRIYRSALKLEIQSFELPLLGMMAADPGQNVLGLIANEPGPDPLATLCGFGARTLSLRHTAVTQELSAVIRGADLRLAAWTVNDPERAVELARLGVDLLIGDDPVMLRQALEQRVES